MKSLATRSQSNDNTTHLLNTMRSRISAVLAVASHLQTTTDRYFGKPVISILDIHPTQALTSHSSDRHRLRSADLSIRETAASSITAAATYSGKLLMFCTAQLATSLPTGRHQITVVPQHLRGLASAISSKSHRSLLLSAPGSDTFDHFAQVSHNFQHNTARLGLQLHHFREHRSILPNNHRS